MTPRTIRNTIGTTFFTPAGLALASAQLGHSEVGTTTKLYALHHNFGTESVVACSTNGLKAPRNRIPDRLQASKIPSPRPSSLAGGDVLSRLGESNSRPIHYE